MCCSLKKILHLHHILPPEFGKFIGDNLNAELALIYSNLSVKV